MSRKRAENPVIDFDSTHTSPCRYGHTSGRYTRGACKQCHRDWRIKNYATKAKKDNSVPCSTGHTVGYYKNGNCIQCTKERQARRTPEQRERGRASARRWLAELSPERKAEFRDKRRADQRRRRAAMTLEERSAAYQAAKAKNPGVREAYTKKYAEKNRQALKERRARWYLANRERIKAQHAEYRALKRREAENNPAV